jgi:hypothetical protein
MKFVQFSLRSTAVPSLFYPMAIIHKEMKFISMKARVNKGRVKGGPTKILLQKLRKSPIL